MRLVARQLTQVDVNVQPSMTIPTAIGINDYHFRSNYKATGLEDLDFHTGPDAVKHASSYSVSYPVRHGIVSLSCELTVIEILSVARRPVG